MSREFLRQLPKRSNDQLPVGASCPICMQPYENQTNDTGSFEKPVYLPCNDNHIFGSDCLSEWFRHSKTCPLCRQELDFPNEEKTHNEEDPYLFLQRHQDWDGYWYVAFWIVQLNGDETIEQEWRQWQEDWIFAAKEYDAGIEAHARSALSMSKLVSDNELDKQYQLKASAAAIQTLRFREYLLYLQLQRNATEYPELSAPPVYQLTPTQDGALFRELEKREAFNLTGCLASTSMTN